MDKLFDLAHFVGCTRPGVDLASPVIAQLPADKITLMEVPALAISSTNCRERVGEQEPIWYLVPDGIVQYIAEARALPVLTMRPEPVEGIDAEIRSRIAGYDWWHAIEVAPGVVTPGELDLAAYGGADAVAGSADRSALSRRRHDGRVLGLRDGAPGSPPRWWPLTCWIRAARTLHPDRAAAAAGRPVARRSGSRPS